MTMLVLRCPSWPDALPAGLPDAHPMPAVPGRVDVDPLLADATPDRIVVAGADADLAAVVLRLLRTGRLGVAVAYLPANPGSAVAATWGLPTDRGTAAALAATGEPEPVPLVRDDAGGVLLGRGVIRPVDGVIYCDERLMLRGRAARLVVTPADPVGVDVRVGRALRTRSARGRAVQVACAEAVALLDGVPHPRPVTRWTWYKHTEDLRLVRPLS
jgi:hypothetical protein